MPAITKVIFFTEVPFIQRDYDRFGIETFQQNGFETEVWDFTPFLHPQVYHANKSPDLVFYKGYRSFLTQTEALRAISTLTPQCFVICFIGYSFYSFQVYRALAKNNIKYGVFSCALPSVLRNANRLTALLHRLKKLLALNSLMLYVSAQFRKILRRIPYSYVGIKPATLIFAGGERYWEYLEYPVNSQSEIVWVHHWDYDLYLKEIQQPAKVDPKIGVFLDEYIPFHPDIAMLGIPLAISAEEYYPLMCRFFDFLETTYGVQIVIAAHPRSRYENHPDYFGGRPVIRGKTIELCRTSGFLMTHHSTAINFAVLFNKPAIFITMDKFQQSPPDRTWIETMASALGKGIININNFTTINWEEELKVDEELYREYRNSYIKKDGSDELSFGQIIAKRLKNF